MKHDLDNEFDVNYDDMINADWAIPRPIKISGIDLPDMPDELLPPKLYDFCEDVANDTNSPIANCAVPLLCALGATIGSKVGIFANSDSNSSWFETANLSGLVLGDASTRKSPPADLVKIYLEHLQNSYQSENEAILIKYETELTAKKIQLKKLEKIATTPIEQIAQLTAEINIMILKGYPQKRLYTSDSTVEKMQLLMVHNPRGIMLFRDEITSTFSNLLLPAQNNYRTFYMEAYKGTSSFAIDRIGRGSIPVPRITFSFFGTAQTKLFKDILKNWENKYKIDGFFARIGLIVVSKKLPPNRFKNTLSSHIRQDIFHLFDALDNYTPESSMYVNEIRVDKSGILGLQLSSQAQTLFDDFTFKLNNDLYHRPVKPEMLDVHIGKQPTMVLKVALILHLSENYDTFSCITINEITMLRALAWHEFIYPHLNFIYSSESIPEQAEDIKMALFILDKIRMKKITDGMTISSIMKKDWSGFKDRSVIESGFDVLQNHGWLEMVGSDFSAGGCPTQKIMLHPKAIELLSDEDNYLLKDKIFETPHLNRLKELLNELNINR